MLCWATLVGIGEDHKGNNRLIEAEKEKQCREEKQGLLYYMIDTRKIGHGPSMYNASKCLLLKVYNIIHLIRQRS